ncbi:type II toxin-antitoxin system HicB family antitoxin [Halorubrum pallidum]|uniref:Type II toxin-antitoxin system HicB family antitoxin n=1 Tax=Halorubrum pallidum TaxID=1526114 RepID=A0ABD5T4W5_9EURY
MSTGREIRLIEEDEGGWSAIDEDFGVVSCGDTREEALEMLDEAVAVHTGEAGKIITNEDLEEWGLDPDESDEVGVPDVPWLDSADKTA